MAGQASKTAVGIRKALSHPPFYFAEPFRVPSASTTMKGNWGFVSSWMSFYSELKLPGCVSAPLPTAVVSSSRPVVGYATAQTRSLCPKCSTALVNPWNSAREQG